MKKTSIVVIALMVISTGFLSGCEELEALDKPDYITVTVHCLVDVKLAGSIGARDVLVRVEIIKDGGERVSEVRKTNSNGNCETVTGTFKLYREQPITCIANVILSSVEQNYSDRTFNSDSCTISWGHIYPNSDFGEYTERLILLSIHEW